MNAPQTFSSPINARVERYVSSLKDKQRREESETLLALFDRVTGLEAQMWGTAKVGYGRYEYEVGGRKSEFMMTGFDPADRAITIYLDQEFEARMGEENVLGKHEKGNSCIKVRALKDIDLTVLATMIEDGLKATRKGYKTKPA